MDERDGRKAGIQVGRPQGLGSIFGEEYGCFEPWEEERSVPATARA